MNVLDDVNIAIRIVSLLLLFPLCRVLLLLLFLCSPVLLPGFREILDTRREFLSEGAYLGIVPVRLSL
jgi:hypothetical protein